MVKKMTKLIRSDYQTGLLLFLSVLLVFIIAYPFIVLMLKSFGVANYSFEGFSFDSYKSVLSDDNLMSSLYNTLFISIGITATTFVVSSFLAWLVVRTDFKYKGFVKALVFLTFTIPSYVLGISWIEFFGRNGYLNKFCNLLGIEYSYNAYSILAVIVVMSIHLYPLVFIAMANALKSVDASLEDAAMLCYASRFKVFKTITLPLILPTIFSVCLFVFSRSMANFGVPSLLLMPIYKETLTTGIYRSLNNLDLSSAAAISMILVLLSTVVFVSQQLLLKNKKYTTISSNSGGAKLVELKNKSKFITIIVFIFQFITTIVPIAVILFTSFMKHWGLEIKLSNLTLNNYKVLLASDFARAAFLNSLIYGIIASVIAILISILVSYITCFTRFRIGKFMEYVSAFPMVMPNIVMAIAAILAWNRGIFDFYGTAIIIILTYTALFLPIAIKQISGLFKNFDSSLEEAARISGASSARAAKDIILPYIVPAIKSSFILLMLIAFREIPISLMLHAPGTETVGVLLFNMRSNASGLEATSTVASVIISVSLLGRLLLRKTKKTKKEVGIHDTSEY